MPWVGNECVLYEFCSYLTNPSCSSIMPESHLEALLRVANEARDVRVVVLRRMADNKPFDCCNIMYAEVTVFSAGAPTVIGEITRNGEGLTYTSRAMGMWR
ncbi:hypothetical protein HYV82_01280 [Candidatus Woesearchaeota archaeon]|nr:hypothetical protein [Candidatus Woesearchaeota archaeon]